MADLAPFIDSLKTHLSMVNTVRPHIKLTKKGRSHLGLCPFHKEKSPSFNVVEDKGFFHCFGCGVNGDHIDFMMRKNNLPFIEAVEHLASLAGMTMPKLERQEMTFTDEGSHSQLYKLMDAACRWFESQLSLTTGSDARDYIERRGLTPEVIKHFRLGFAPSHGLSQILQKQGFSEAQQIEAGLLVVAENGGRSYDRFRDRVIFPILDPKGHVIAFGGRLMQSGEPKYLNSPETPIFHKGRTLYAYPQALASVRSGKAFILAEGYMDVIALHQAGFTEAVAPLGTAFTPEQMALMWRSCDSPILCFDGDAAGRKAAERAALRSLPYLKPGHSLAFCYLPAGEDPDSLLLKGERGKLEILLRKPIQLVDVLWDVFISERDMKTPEKKATARQDLMALMRDIADPEIRHFYQDDLNARLTAVLTQEPIASFKKGTSSAPFLRHQVPPAIKSCNWHKILLVTLINHPTLIQEVVEQLVEISDFPRVLEPLRDFLLSTIGDTACMTAQELREMLRLAGFTTIIDELLSPGLYLRARFAQQSESVDDAREGWLSLWENMVGKKQLALEIDELVEHLQVNFDERTWLRIKELKAKLSERITG